MIAGVSLRQSFLTLLLCAGLVENAWAQSGANVLVVANGANADSVLIAERYAAARKVPADQVLRLDGLGADVVEQMTRAIFDTRIAAPIARWLASNVAQDRIHYIVLTKGVPLRIQGTSGREGTVSSVDSELAVLYGRMTGAVIPTAGRIANPYFLGDAPLSEARPFSHEHVPLYLVTRLDGFSTADALALIDRASTATTAGRFVFDQRSSWRAVGNDWLKAAADRLAERGLADRVLLEVTGRVVTGEKDVLGYYSWGSNDPAIRQRRFDFGFVPGALAAMFVSYDGRTFKEPPATWKIGSWERREDYFGGAPQSLAGDLIREGVTGIAAHVDEPYLDATIRPQILFPAYTAGFNLAESFYLAMSSVSWQTVVVGDPLCAPFQKTATTDLDPGLDPDTELPRWFSGRRLKALEGKNLALAGRQQYLLSEARRARGDTAGARKALAQAVALEPRLVNAQMLHASELQLEQKYVEANASYQAILKEEPDHLMALNNLAFNLADRLGKPQDALPLAQRAYTVGGRAAAVADTLGWVYFLLGDYQQAAALIGPAAQAATGSAEIQLHAARVFAAAGRKEPAGTFLAKALELDPNLATSPDVAIVRAALK